MVGVYIAYMYVGNDLYVISRYIKKVNNKFVF